MSKPNGAMSATSTFKDLTGGGRGTPPRYSHLPHSEAWAKIDAEQAEMQRQADEVRIENEVQKRLSAIQESTTAEVSHNSFEGKEMSQVLQVLSTLGDVEQASNVGIVIEVNDVKVLVSKA